MKLPNRKGALRALLAIVAPVVTHGQESSDSERDTDREEDVFELSPFEVNSSDDRSYRATNSISGTRLNTPIKDIPLSLEVITGQFLKDTGATNLREALRYSSGVVLESQYDGLSGALINSDQPGTAQANNPESATRSSSQSVFKIRGYVAEQTLRDGFRRQHATDTVNISRVEVLRGPSALLYGIGNFGGIVNYIPNRPTEEVMGEFSVSAGSQGFARFDFDHSFGTLWKNDRSSLRFRLAGAYQENGDETEFYDHKHWFVAPMFEYRPFENTKILLDMEFGDATDYGVGFQRVRSNVLTGGFPWQTNQRTTDFYSPPAVDERAARWSGPDTYLKNPSSNLILDVEQKLGDKLWLKAGVARSSVEFDSSNIWYGQFNSLDPYVRDDAGSITGFSGGNQITMPRYYRAPNTAGESAYLDALAAATPSNLRSVFEGRPGDFWLGDIYGSAFTSRSQFDPVGSASTSYFTTLNYQWASYTTKEDRDQVRVELNYSKELFGAEHSFLLGAQYMGTEQTNNNYGQDPALVSNGAPQSNDPLIWNYKNPNDSEPIRRPFQGDGVTPTIDDVHLTWSFNKTWDMGYYFVYQGKFMEDRLSFIGGLRYDRNDTRGLSQNVWDPNSEVELVDRNNPENLYPPSDAPNRFSPQYGLSFKVNDRLSLYAVHSEGLQPAAIGTLAGDGKPFESITAKNDEIGVKFELMEGRISGSLAAFKIERSNIARSIWWAPAPGVPAPLSGHATNYDPEKPVALGFYSWGGLRPYYAWAASRSDVGGTEAWNQIYPGMADILKLIPKDPSRTYAGKPLPLGMTDVFEWNGPGVEAVDANGNGMGMTVAELWTQTLTSQGVAVPNMPSDASAYPFFDMTAPNVWEAAWQMTHGLMLADQRSGHTAAQELYSMLFDWNAASQYESAVNGASNVHGWGSEIPWLWAGNNERDPLPYYPGFWGSAPDYVNPDTGETLANYGYHNSILGMNSAKVPFTDEAEGWEFSLNMAPLDNWQIVFSWSHIENRNSTAKYQYVDTNDPAGNDEFGLWAAAGGNFGTFILSREEAFEDPSRPSTVLVAPSDYGLSLDDTPEDSASFWTKYDFVDGRFAGLGFGLGVLWNSERLYDASVAVDGTVSGDFDPETNRIVATQLYTSDRTTVNAMVDYRTKWREKYDVRYALNVDNVLDDKDLYGYIYAPGLTWKLSASFAY